MLITATWIGKLCFYMVIIGLALLFLWNINLLFSKENDIYRSGRLSFDSQLEGLIDLQKENWLIAFELTYPAQAKQVLKDAGVFKDKQPARSFVHNDGEVVSNDGLEFDVVKLAKYMQMQTVVEIREGSSVKRVAQRFRLCEKEDFRSRNI